MSKLLLKLKNNLSNILGLIIIIFLIILFGKLLIFDCVVGEKVYDKNDIIIRYHRIINIVTIKNNSNNKIFMHYQYGRCKNNGNIDDRTCTKIKYYKKSEDYQIEENNKFIKFIGMFDDAYIFTVSNDKNLYDSVLYNKRDWF